MEHTPYTQCASCSGWLRLDMPHITATVDYREVHIHDEACLRILLKRTRITNIKRIHAVIYQD